MRIMLFKHRLACAFLPVLVGLICPTFVDGWNIALEVTTQAGGAYGGEPFADQPIVTVFDKRGELQSSFVGRVTAQADAAPNGRHEPVWREGEAAPGPGGHVSQDVADGRAAFGGLGIDAAGEGYRLKFVLYDEHGLIMGTIVGDEFAVQIGEKYRLGLAVQPEMAYGGSPFGSQPLLAVQDRGGNTVVDVNDGTVAVSLLTGTDGSALRCADGSGFSIPVKNGLASFEGLFINEAGTHYSLHFSTDILLEGASEVASNIFSVGVGPAARVALISDASDGSVFGGRAFTPQPRAEVHDAGGNVLVDDSFSAVKVSFYSNPSRGKLSPAGGTVERLRRGVVQFRNLSIDKAGIRYRLTYELLDYDHDGARLLDTSIRTHGSYFDVDIGPPRQLSILQHTSGGWAGNQPFPIQPKVALLDAGGNVVLGDSTSTVTAHVTPSLAINSWVIIDTSNDAIPGVTEVKFAASISDDPRLVYGPGDVVEIEVVFSQEVTVFQTEDNGALLPQITLNAIDGVGSGAVHAELVSPQQGLFSRTLSFEYMVEIGHAQSELDYLSTASLHGNGYSVEDAFGRKVDLILPAAGSGASLSASKVVGISDERPKAQGVSADLPDGEYGAGHEVTFVLAFDREVAVTGRPGLPLDVWSSVAVIDTFTTATILPGSHFNVVYKGEKSEPIPWNAPASKVEDAVESLQSVAGDVCVSRAPSPNALSAGGYRWAIRFDDIRDTIFDLLLDDAGLIFSGAGGSMAASFIATDGILSDWATDDGEGGMCTTRAATYVDGSGTKRLRFNFQVLPGDAAGRLDVPEMANLLFPTPEDGISLLVNSPGASAIQADPDIESISMPAVQTISVDTSPPRVLSITPQDSTTPSGTYAVGDSLFFEVTFDKPVEVDIGLELMLNTNGGIARYLSGSGTDTMLLEYVVEEGDATSDIDVRDSNSLVAQNTEGRRYPVAGSVCRQSSPSSCGTAANLDISNIASMADTHDIVIDGERPYLLDVSFDAGDEGKAFGRGDTVTILVAFSALVVVNESSPPIFGVLVGVQDRWATYLSGSGTSTLRFSYQVTVGDSSAPLQFHYRRFCHQNMDCTDTKGLIVRLSATLELDSDLDTGFSDQGVPIAASPEAGVTIDTSSAPATTIASTTVANAAGTHGVGAIIDILVQFTDPVFLTGSMPTLVLNIASFASYHAGHGTDTLTFRFVSAEADATPKLDWDLDSATNSAITCEATCSIENGNGVAVDTRFHDPVSDASLVGPLEPVIALDPSPPLIVSVNTDKAKSPYCHPLCTYTVGEGIDIFVQYDRPVVVEGTELFLIMDVGDAVEGNRAAYVPYRSTENELVFHYTVRHGHSSDGESLTYLCSESPGSLQLGGGMSVKGAAAIPTLEADLTLPPCSQHGLSGDESNPVIIDTSGQPHVIDASSTNPNGEYGPGDIIEIAVQFSKTVIVSGEPYLTLDVGSSEAGNATYKNGSGTSTLLFQYEVGLDHTTLGLEYIDSHSLHLGFDGVSYGSIKQMSTTPSVDAIAELPFPGDVGSLGSTSDVRIDSRKPFISMISSTPGEYSTGDIISIYVRFSRPVVVDGTPLLVLEMGLVERIAEYKGQANDDTMEFCYTVQLGDTAERLDYWSDQELLPSSSMSLRLNGGSVKLQGTNPSLDADLHLNPIGGSLEGGKEIKVSEGVALFRDLKIGQRGKDFKVWFQSTVHSTGAELQVSETSKIDASIEFEVQGDLTNRDSGDRYGSAVSLHGGMLAVGAPGHHNPTPEIQVLTVYSEAAIVEHEVQIIATSVNRSEAVISSQEFKTCADAGETIGGSFTLTYKIDGVYAFASPLEFNANVSSSQLKSVLENKLDLIGLIATSKSTNPMCESHNSWVWSVTFLDSLDGVGVIETNGDLLVGQGAHISESFSIRDVDLLQGSFRLMNPFNQMTSRGIPHGASSALVKDAIEEDLAISVLSVQVENMYSEHAGLGRRWTVIFEGHDGAYGPDINVPQLQAMSEGLLGKDSRVWTYTGFEGRGVLSGTFSLAFRGSDPSYFVSHDSTEEEIAAALESLDSINQVSVSNRRTFLNEVGKSGCSWTITFDSVNELTDYGWLPDPGGASTHGNLPSLVVTPNLIGWNAGYIVQRETGRGEEDTQAQWMVKEMGDDGSGSGNCFIFRHVGEAWKKEAIVMASDYNSKDAFGASLSIASDYLLVGAPSKEVDGLPEQQKLTCSGPASDGFFVINFRGFTSDSIPYDATLAEIQTSMVGLYGGTGNIHPTPRILFASGSENWDGLSSGFCSGIETSISVTFLTPDGGGISTAEKRSGDIETLTIDQSNLIGATISVEVTREGTKSPMGRDLENSEPTGKQSGSAYMYQRHKACNYCEPAWTEIKKFTPFDGLDSPTDAAEFGMSTVFVPTTDLAIIGSPGFFHGSGKVYIFNVVHGSWALLDSLTDKNWNHQKIKGGRFGSSISADSDTILVGSPGHSNEKGAVYVFRRSQKGKPFLASQAIYGPSDLSDGDGFGHSVALYHNRAVLCAPHKTTDAIHLTTLAQQPRQTGACFVYSREDRPSAFELDQQLIPSNVLAGDRFGWSVAMSSNRIVVGQVEKVVGRIDPPRPVQIIKTFCKHPPCKNAAASKFRLRWIDTTSWSQFLLASTSANQMRDAIEASLLSGAASVSRSVLPDKDGGHTWRVTFDSYDSTFRNLNEIPTIQCDAFVTSSLSCETRIEHGVPRHLRGKAHLFDLDESTETWTEQAFLFSNRPQKQDLLGTSVAIDGDFAVAGAPNRELLNVNSGAAMIYDISFLNLNFPDSPYSLTEGDISDIDIERSSTDHRQVVSLRSMDSNADENLQHYVNVIFSLRSLDLTSHDKTPVHLLTANSAMGRSQYYGSNEGRSLFVKGMFDVQGMNDYELLDFEGQINPGENTITARFKTNDDSILEMPNENVTVQINLRGMFASQLGRLKADIDLSDNGDGISPEGESQYQVLDGHNHEESARMGVATGIDRAAEMLIVGSDQTSGIDADGNELNDVGSATIFKRSSTGSWEVIETLFPPLGDIQARMRFGQSVAINKAYGREDVTILIGAPGVAAAYVYVFAHSTWVLQAKLSANDGTLFPEDNFGGRGSIALQEDMAFIGSSSMEQVYVFRRTYVAGEGFVTWDSYEILRSSDYDYDVFGHGFSIKHMHRQGFGIALAASRRTLLVGAPYADYGNRGDVNEREHRDTDGIHNKGVGKGKVYSFYSQPHVQIVSLRSDEIIASGSFKLKLDNHQGLTEDISGHIMHDSSPHLCKAALEEMLTVGKVNVEASEVIEDGSYEMSWRISFLSNFADSLPILIPQWFNHGCTDCEVFKVSVLSTLEPFVSVASVHSHQPYVQDGEMQPRDVTSTDSFGSSIALDGPQAIIGASGSPAKTRTTWDFETGNLQGWSATGSAFKFQPTFGDNSKFRAVYEGYGNAASHTSGESQSSRTAGRYYVGTFEKRPRSSLSYQLPNSSEELGSTQGDGPTGTLTSDPFMIRGSTISFLVGGGCNHLTAFIELLVDGYPSLRATGKCSERMDRVEWDVEMFKNRSGQIRIVDRGSNKWDHINIDDINFSWSFGGNCAVNNFGQCAEGGGALPKRSAESDKQHYTGKEESPMAGAAYMFTHECSEMDFDDLSASNTNCEWVEQERLVASDKRDGNMFGISVDIDYEQGIAIIGSSNAPAYGFYQEPVPVYPHSNSTIELPISAHYEDLMKSGRTYSATGGNLRLFDHLNHKDQTSVHDQSELTEQAGSLYVFLQQPAKYGPRGDMIEKAFWLTSEHAKISPPDVSARDHFGFSVSLDSTIESTGITAISGAVGRDGHIKNGGGAFVYDMEWVRVKFQDVEFVARESDRIVKVFVERDRSHRRFSIGYSTSDLTAVGVDSIKYDECMSTPAPDRGGCGDYEQSSGTVTFNLGEQHAYFTIRILDDKCSEPHMEYVQLNLHQIGGSPLRGESYRAQLRIDDDDWPGQALSMNCTIGIR